MKQLRWSAFLLVVLAYVLSFFHRYAPATISIELQNDFQASSAALGGLAATYFYVYMVMQVPTGVLADTMGPRKVVTIGGLISGAGSIMFGLSDTLAWASVGRLFVGLGVSVTFISLLKLNAVWFHERHFGTMTGASVLIGNLGAMLAALPLAWASAWAGWRMVFVWVGVVSLLLALMAWRWVQDHPGKSGLPSMRELDGKQAHPEHTGHWYDGLMIVMRNRATWPGFWVNLGLCGSLFSFAGLWAVPLLHNGYGMDIHTATLHTTLLLAGFALGALLIGVVSDRMGKRKPVMMLWAALYTLCWLPFLLEWHMSTTQSLILFGMMGLFAPGFTLSWACAKEVNPHALSGMATSVVNIGAFLGPAILQPLVGLTIDYSVKVSSGSTPVLADFHSGLVILFLFSLGGLISVLYVRETYCAYLK